MDVIIPAHNLKTLSSSLSTLSKIGKYLYFEFDPLTGLTLRTINDAKSSFGQFHFDVGFFERCTCPPGSILSKKNSSRTIGIVDGAGSSNGGSGNGNGNGSRTNRNRNRNRIEANERSLRSNTAKRGRRRKRSRSQQPDDDENHDNGAAADYSDSAHNAEDSIENRQHSNGNSGGDDDDDDDDVKYLCRVFIKTVASVLRSRRGVQSLRIRSLGSQFEGGRNNNMNRNDRNGDGGENTNRMAANSNGDDNGCGGDGDGDDDDNDGGAKMQLSFEFRIQSEGVMRIKHIISVSEADAVVAVAEKTGCSEIVVTPRVLLKMVEPVKSSEVALIISDTEKRVTATSFHYTDAATRNASASALLPNALLSANAATVLKTETSIGVDEFDEFNFLDGNGEDLPDGADKEVVLVFSIKEAKAMLQFCAQTSIDEELRAIVSFYWGGRPLIIETEGDSFTGELILATVAHNLLNGVDLTSRGSNGGNTRRIPNRN